MSKSIIEVEREERVAMLALNKIFGFAPQKGRNLLSRFKDAAGIFHLSRKYLLDIGLYEDNFIDKINQKSLEDAENELDKIKDLGAYFITIKDSYYPALLRECADAPLGLYIKSTSSAEKIFDKQRMYISVVGTRDISAYGREVTTELIRTIANSTIRPTIVSGLAMGVDVTAHNTAMECNLPTIAVMATGIERVYPFNHGWIADKISQAPNSALITDYPLETIPYKYNFLRRNRIMAGLCGTTILIESKIKGGGLVTARLAYSYNRDVYAIPGRINDYRSQGCNKLIKENVANPLIDYELFMKDAKIGLDSKVQKVNFSKLVQEKYQSILSSEDLENILNIIHLIIMETEISQENICSQLDLGYRNMTFLTGLLESDGFIIIDLLHNCSINQNFV